MSNRPCNFCEYIGILSRAVKAGNEVTKVPCVDTEIGGVDVYAHPKGVTPEDKHFQAWFMALPDHCVC